MFLKSKKENFEICLQINTFLKIKAMSTLCVLLFLTREIGINQFENETKTINKF